MNKADRLLVKEEVAAILRVPPATLYAWRDKGIGPQAVRMGRRLVWRESDVHKHIENAFKPEPQAAA